MYEPIEMLLIVSMSNIQIPMLYNIIFLSNKHKTEIVHRTYTLKYTIFKKYRYTYDYMAGFSFIPCTSDGCARVRKVTLYY